MRKAFIIGGVIAGVALGAILTFGTPAVSQMAIDLLEPIGSDGSINVEPLFFDDVYLRGTGTAGELQIGNDSAYSQGFILKTGTSGLYVFNLAGTYRGNVTGDIGNFYSMTSAGDVTVGNDGTGVLSIGAATGAYLQSTGTKGQLQLGDDASFTNSGVIGIPADGIATWFAADGTTRGTWQAGYLGAYSLAATNNVTAGSDGTGQFIAPDGSAAAPSYSFSTDSGNTGFWLGGSSSPYYIGAAVNGVNVAEIGRFNTTFYQLVKAKEVSVDSNGYLGFRDSTGGGGTADTYFTRHSAGNLQITGGLALGDPGTRPTCDSSARGMFWVDEGGTGVADSVAVCAKDSGDAYAWRTIY